MPPVTLAKKEGVIREVVPATRPAASPGHGLTVAGVMGETLADRALEGAFCSPVGCPAGHRFVTLDRQGGRELRAEGTGSSEEPAKLGR